jgi:hypothetical protein
MVFDGGSLGAARRRGGGEGNGQGMSTNSAQLILLAFEDLFRHSCVQCKYNRLAFGAVIKKQDAIMYTKTRFARKGVMCSSILRDAGSYDGNAAYTG